MPRGSVGVFIGWAEGGFCTCVDGLLMEADREGGRRRVKGGCDGADMVAGGRREKGSARGNMGVEGMICKWGCCEGIYR